MSDTHTYTGVVTEGSGKACMLGFPTINIPLTDGALSGVYAGKATVQGKIYIAAVYADQRRKILEAHLLDFSGGAVKGVVAIELGEKVREDKMFADDESLKAAIADDVTRVRFLSSNCSE